MALLFGTIAGILLMLTVSGIIGPVEIIAISIGIIIGCGLIGIIPSAKFINWRNER